MSRLLISAAHKSSGKTTLSIGLCAALREQGLQVQPFKKGPDYIDPLWLGEAAGRPCHNLDFYTQSHTELTDSLAHYSADADLVLVEGNKGLYDGVDLDGSNSNAALAHLLGLPVVLVLDSRGVTRGVAPLLLGYRAFDENIRFAGVIFNQVGGSRHESKLRAVIEHYTDVPVLGAVHKDRELQIVERHLGLMPSNEDQSAADIIQRLAEAVRSQVDLDKVLAAATLPPLKKGVAKAGSPLWKRGVGGDFQNSGVKNPPRPPFCKRGGAEDKVRIGVLRDAAFGFYYPGDLEGLQTAGAELIFIDALHDTGLPALDGLFIGGGFPEVRMRALAANKGMKAAVRNAVASGLPVYAECGGLMYLGRRLRWQDTECEMAGALPFDTYMAERPQGRGYVRLQETGAGLWPLRDADGQVAAFPAHEFHYSRVENLAPDAVFAYRVLRGHGIDGEHDGLVYHNTLASYTHLRDVAQNRWTQRFVAFVRSRT